MVKCRHNNLAHDINGKKQAGSRYPPHQTRHKICVARQQTPQAAGARQSCESYGVLSELPRFPRSHPTLFWAAEPYGPGLEGIRTEVDAALLLRGIDISSGQNKAVQASLAPQKSDGWKSLDQIPLPQLLSPIPSSETTTTTTY